MIGGEDEAHRRDVSRGKAASAEDNVDETPSDSAVAIRERVNGLELRVGDRGLSDRGDILALDELAEVDEQRAHPLFRRRDKFGSKRRVVAAADPALFRSDPSRDRRVCLT